MQISSRIDLQLFCQCNNSNIILSSQRKVDQTERVANWEDEKIAIDLSRVQGRNR